ncbi:MAG: hypothetical protein ACQKBY_09755 [Verrucomicrobiales bacterium]
MKIALKNEGTHHWLAGQPGVSERTHSSAAGLAFGGEVIQDPQTAIRAAAKVWQDRGNYEGSVSFSTTRKFTTKAAAEEFAALYDLLWPRTGDLDLYGADGQIVARLTNVLVSPPSRRVYGVSVDLDYTVVGGLMEAPEGGGFDDPEYTMAGEAVTMNGQAIV